MAEKNKAQLEQQQSGTDSIVIARLAKELEDKDAQIHAAKDELAHLKEQVKGKA